MSVRCSGSGVFLNAVTLRNKLKQTPIDVWHSGVTINVDGAVSVDGCLCI